MINIISLVDSGVKFNVWEESMRKQITEKAKPIVCNAQICAHCIDETQLHRYIFFPATPVPPKCKINLTEELDKAVKDNSYVVMLPYAVTIIPLG